MNISPRLSLSVLVCLLLITGSVSAISAEKATVTIRENDTLSTIVQAAYPEIRNRNPVMQLILQRNPEAFRNNDINFLIIGKVLELPGAGELAALNLPPAPVRQSTESATNQANQTTQVDTETVQRLQRIAEERDELKKQLQQLEADKQSLRDNIAQFEQVKDQQDEQLAQLQQQLETLQASLKQQEMQAPGQTAVNAADGEALAAARTELEQLQARFQESEQDKQTLQNQLAVLKQRQAAVATDTAAANTETEKLQQEITTLQATISELETEKTALQTKITDLETKQETLQSEKSVLTEQAGQFQQTLGELESSNKTQTEANSKLQEQITLLQQDSDILRTDNEQLRADLQAAQDQLVTSDLDIETLRADLAALDKKNSVLQSELDQIQAAAASDVTLAPTEAPQQPTTPLWPWLLMLGLLPVAWFMGQRSRPAPAEIQAQSVTPVSTTEQRVVDPVIPAPLTRDEMAGGEFASSTVATVPDDPDVAIKLDMARAYLDLRNAEAANDVLQEVMREGGSQQQQEAKEMLSFIS